MKRRKHSQREEAACKPVAPSDSSRPKYHLFPNYSLHLVLFVVLVGRLNYVTDPVSWWTLHPDEIYQVIEVAHSDVYGYGFESKGHQRPLYSEYGLDSTRESMRGIHSWIVPKFYSWALTVKDAFNIATRPYLFCRQLHAVVSGLLPVALFFLCRRLYPDWPSDVATIAAILVGFGDYFLLIGTHTLPQSLLSTVLFSVAALLYKRNATPVSVDTNDNYALKQTNPATENKLGALGLAGAGFFQGFVCYVKPDAAVVVVLLHVFLYKESEMSGFRSVTSFAAGTMFGSVLCGYFDFVYYGMWFISPFRWFSFEWGHAGNVYGHTDTYHYLELLLLSPGTFAVMALASVSVSILYFTLKYSSLLQYRELHHWALENRDTVIVSIKLCTCSLFVILMHSLQPHKDLRYIYDALILMSCSGAGALFSLYQLLRILSESQNQDKLVFALKLFVYAEVALYAMRALSPGAIHTRFTDMSEPVIPDTPKTWHVNRCLDFTGRQLDLTGVILDHPIHLSGGYCVLHSNVPIFAKTHYDFREWDMKSRINFSSETAISFHQSLASFERISNYVAEENGKLILSISAQADSPYNYAVLTRNRKFPKQGFREVFRSGNVTVFKRLKSRNAVTYLSDLVQKITLGTDVNVLQVEASWLMAFGLPSVARARLERALELDIKCLSCWQLLHGVYLDLGLPSDAQRIGKECVSALGKENCSSKSKVHPLHPGYNFGISRLRQPKPIVL